VLPIVIVGEVEPPNAGVPAVALIVNVEPMLYPEPDKVTWAVVTTHSILSPLKVTSPVVEPPIDGIEYVAFVVYPKPFVKTFALSI